jgi:hypothetical protein
MWDLWWTKWHWDRFFSELSVLPCRFHSTGAPLRVKIGKKTAHPHLHHHWGCIKSLKVVVLGPSIQKKKGGKKSDTENTMNSSKGGRQPSCSWDLAKLSRSDEERGRETLCVCVCRSINRGGGVLYFGSYYTDYSLVKMCACARTHKIQHIHIGYVTYRINLIQ